MDARPVTVLQRSGETHQFDFAVWHTLLTLAQQHGWTPAGTAMPDHLRNDGLLKWRGDYTSGLGEAVSAEDADRLANALYSTLDDLPDQEMPARIIVLAEEDLEGTDGDSWGWTLTGPDLSLYEMFGGQYKQGLIDFIDFCCRGGFQIVEV